MTVVIKTGFRTTLSAFRNNMFFIRKKLIRKWHWPKIQTGKTKSSATKNEKMHSSPDSLNLDKVSLNLLDFFKISHEFCTFFLGFL